MQRNGFTLIELLVVLVILGLAAGAVALTIPNGEDKVTADATELAGRIAAIRDRAIVEGRPLGIAIAATGYSFEARGNDTWEPYAAEPFSAETWRSDVVADIAGAERLTIRFNSVGMPAAPAVITLRGPDESWRQVEIAASGDVKARQ